MSTIGIVGEGITDQKVIESILIGYLRDCADGPFFNYVQPPLDESGRRAQPAAAGWGVVFQFLDQREHERALQWNDYLVIHLDTDVSEQKGYDVAWREQGRELSAEELCDRVVARPLAAIGKDFYARHRRRFVFAIAVHAIECWLLPLLVHGKKAAKTKGCPEAADRACRQANRQPLRRGDRKDPRAYELVSKGFRDRRRLLEVKDLNPSLRVFVAALDAAFAEP
jgi:hypothetical protein